MLPPESNSTGTPAPHTREVPTLRCSYCGLQGPAPLAFFSDGTAVGPEGWLTIETQWTGRVEGQAPGPLHPLGRTTACPGCAPAFTGTPGEKPCVASTADTWGNVACPKRTPSAQGRGNSHCACWWGSPAVCCLCGEVCRGVTPALDALANANGQQAQRIAALVAENEELRLNVGRLVLQKDGAYAERNQCVALLVKLALRLGWRAGVREHPAEDTTWEADWRTVVFIDLPTGQVSWHFHDREKYLLGGLPRYVGTWDGHSTPEKYQRVREVQP